MTQHNQSLNTALQALITDAAGGWTLEACGVTRSQHAIPALVHQDAYLPTTWRARVVLLGGLSGRQEDVELTLQALAMYLQAGEPVRRTLALSAVPCGNPDGLALGAAPGNGAGGQPEQGYPPAENFFYDAHNPENRYLWRWIGLQAPDLVLELRAGPTVTWESPVSTSMLAPVLVVNRMVPDDSFLSALGTGNPNGVGPIPGLRLTTPAAALGSELQRLWALLQKAPGLRPSPARRTLDTRRGRTPVEVARLLATVYGHTLDPVIYTQGMAISGRLRLARLDTTLPDPTADIVRLVEPYVSGAKEMFAPQASTGSLAGAIWGMQLAEVTRDRRYADLMIAIAERYRAGAAGGPPPPSDADFRTEDMFMNGAMLGRAFRLSGVNKYIDFLADFLVAAPTQQHDGLFWHCRSGPYYWGRGNGFAALGLSEALAYMPEEHPQRPALLRIHARHLEALRQYQLASGMFPQVLNVPGSYQEFTVTCMLGFAMARGVRRGWLPEAYGATIDQAWQGVVERIDDQGGLLDCCTNTGVQDSVQAYLDRPAIVGHDDRGGAMAMWFALEIEQLRRPRR